MTPLTPIQTANKFVAMVDGFKYQEAEEFLADDFVFILPLQKKMTKETWKTDFPKLLNSLTSLPLFDEFEQQGKSNNRVSRNGQTQMGKLKIPIVETFTFNENGEIKRITLRR